PPYENSVVRFVGSTHRVGRRLRAVSRNRHAPMAVIAHKRLSIERSAQSHRLEASYESRNSAFTRCALAEERPAPAFFIRVSQPARSATASAYLCSRTFGPREA